MIKPVIALLLSTLTLSSIANETAVKETAPMQAGLWEITTSSDLLLLAQHIPANQLKGLEALAKEYGLEMPKLDNGTAISKVCITQNMVNQKTLPNFYQKELGCRSVDATRDGDRYQTRFTCDSAQLKGNGTAKGIITSPTSLTGTTQFAGLAQGIKVNETADVTGKWVNKDCGDIKPL